MVFWKLGWILEYCCYMNSECILKDYLLLNILEKFKNSRYLKSWIKDRLLILMQLFLEYLVFKFKITNVLKRSLIFFLVLILLIQSNKWSHLTQLNLKLLWKFMTISKRLKKEKFQVMSNPLMPMTLTWNI